MKYAVEPRIGKAAVMVSAYPEGNHLIIEIADNGPGIDFHYFAKFERAADGDHQTARSWSEHAWLTRAYERAQTVVLVRQRLRNQYPFLPE